MCAFGGGVGFKFSFFFVVVVFVVVLVGHRLGTAWVVLLSSDD